MSKFAVQDPPSRVGLALAANRLGVWPVLSVVGGAIAPLTVVAGGATTGWALAAILAIPLAYLVVAVLLSVFSGGYTAMSSRFKGSSPLYTFTAKGLGRPAGVGAGYAALLAYGMMVVGLAGGFGAVAPKLMSDTFDVTAPWWVYSLIVTLAVGVLAILPVEFVTKVLAMLLAAEVAVTVIYAVVMFAHPAGGHMSYTAIDPRQIGVAGFGAALAIAVAGFVGIECSGNMAGESKNPRRTVPMATYLAVVIIGLVYGGAALAMVVGAGPDNIIALSTKDATDTMFNLVAPHVPVWLVTLGKFLLLSSLFAAALAFHTVWARYGFGMGRENAVFRWMSFTWARTNAPVGASLAMTVLTVLTIGVYAVNGWAPLVYLFFWLTVVGGFGVLCLLVLTSAATVKFFARLDNRRRERVGVVRTVIFPALAVLTLGWVAVETLQQFHLLLGVDATSAWRWIFPSLFVAVFLLGVLRAVAAKPEIYRAFGTNGPPGAPLPPRPETPATVTSGW